MKSKAIFLLVIFLLNTVVGLGCALGMEGDNDKESHSHEKSAKHEHKGHAHKHASGHEHKAPSKSAPDFSKEDPCCKTLVNELVTQSKLIPVNGKIQVVLPVMLLPEYSYVLLISESGDEPDQSSYIGQRERPPDKDIRISIQSFQI